MQDFAHLMVDNMVNTAMLVSWKYLKYLQVYDHFISLEKHHPIRVYHTEFPNLVFYRIRGMKGNKGNTVKPVRTTPFWKINS